MAEKTIKEMIEDAKTMSFKQEQNRFTRDDVTLSLVRALGFDNMMPLHGDAEERVFFVGPLGERGAHASEEAIKEFIAYYERQIETAKLYLANGRNNKTHEWTNNRTCVKCGHKQKAHDGDDGSCSDRSCRCRDFTSASNKE